MRGDPSRLISLHSSLTSPRTRFSAPPWHARLSALPVALWLVFSDEASCDRCYVHHLRRGEGSRISAHHHEGRPRHQHFIPRKVCVGRHYAAVEDVQSGIDEGK